MRGQIAAVKFSRPSYPKTPCFRCIFFDGDPLNPARMGYCRTAKKPDEVIKVKQSCDKYAPKKEYQK